MSSQKTWINVSRLLSGLSVLGIVGAVAIGQPLLALPLAIVTVGGFGVTTRLPTVAPVATPASTEAPAATPAPTTTTTPAA